MIELRKMEDRQEKKERFQLTPRRHIRQVHSLFIAQLGQHQRSDDIAAHRLDPVALAPVDVRPSGLAGAVDDASRSELVEDLAHARLVFHADFGGVHDLALGFEQSREVAADPALAAGEEEAVFLVHGWVLLLLTLLIILFMVGGFGVWVVRNCGQCDGSDSRYDIMKYRLRSWCTNKRPACRNRPAL